MASAIGRELDGWVGKETLFESLISVQSGCTHPPERYILKIDGCSHDGDGRRQISCDALLTVGKRNHSPK